MIKGSVQQEDITFVNIYTPNIAAPNYIKQMLTDLREKQKCNNEEILIFQFHQWLYHPDIKSIRQYWP